MSRRTQSEIRAERDRAIASLDDAVSEAAAEVTASTAKGLAYHTEMEEIDETIVRLRKRRAELYDLRKAHSTEHARLRSAAYARVNDLCNVGRVASARRLVIAAQLVYGSSNTAITIALREGRKLLQTLDDEPFLCNGYVWLTRHGMWCGARTAGSPHVDLVAGAFCIVMPIIIGGQQEECNVPIRRLAERTDTIYVSKAQVYIGEEDIAAGLAAQLKGVAAGSEEYAHVQASLYDAGFGQGRSQSLLAAAIATE